MQFITNKEIIWELLSAHDIPQMPPLLYTVLGRPERTLLVVFPDSRNFDIKAGMRSYSLFIH